MPRLEIHGDGMGVFVAPEGASNRQLAMQLGWNPFKAIRRGAGAAWRGIKKGADETQWFLRDPQRKIESSRTWGKLKQCHDRLFKKAREHGSAAVTDHEIMVCVALRERIHYLGTHKRWTPMERQRELASVRYIVQNAARQKDAELARGGAPVTGMFGEEDPGDQLIATRDADPLMVGQLGFDPEDALAEAADRIIESLGGLGEEPASKATVRQTVEGFLGGSSAGLPQPLQTIDLLDQDPQSLVRSTGLWLRGKVIQTAAGYPVGKWVRLAIDGRDVDLTGRIWKPVDGKPPAVHKRVHGYLGHMTSSLPKPGEPIELLDQSTGLWWRGVADAFYSDPANRTAHALHKGLAGSATINETGDNKSLIGRVWRPVAGMSSNVGFSLFKSDDEKKAEIAVSSAGLLNKKKWTAAQRDRVLETLKQLYGESRTAVPDAITALGKYMKSEKIDVLD